MKVKELMTSDVACCSPSDTLDRAMDIMWQRDCGCVPVCAEVGGRLVGMITDRDIAIAAYTQGRTLGDIPVAAVMAKEVVAVGPEDSIPHVEQLMQSNQVRRLPVIDGDGRVQGMLSLNDLALAATRRRPKVSPQEISQTLGAIGEHRAMPVV